MYEIMPKNQLSPEVVKAVNEYLADHVEEIRKRNKGKLENMWSDFQNSTNLKISLYSFKKLMSIYRKTNNIEFIVLTREPKKPKTKKLQDFENTEEKFGDIVDSWLRGVFGVNNKRDEII
jgi:hypothetical protein